MSSDQAIGMMDGAYFVGRKEILDWVNSTCALGLTKVEQTCTGAVACMILDSIFPGKVPMSKVDWSANKDYEYINNYKILQKVFTNLKIDRHIEVDKLIRGKYQDNLEFMQWYKRFYELNGGGTRDYDAFAQREKGKGGAAYSQKFKFTAGGAGSSASSTTSSQAAPVAKRRPAGTTRSSAKPPSAPSSIEKERAIVTKRPSDTTSNAEVEQLTKENEMLADANSTLGAQIEGLEKERDFYFGKLRDIELLLQDLEESDHNDTVKSIFNILQIMSMSPDGRKRSMSSDETTTDEDFYDAHDDERESPLGTAVVPVDLAVIPENDGSRREETMRSMTTSDGSDSRGDEESCKTDDAFVVRNKDTGEVYDIRELDAHPVDCYTIFPQNFEPPQDREDSNEQHIQGEKTKTSLKARLRLTFKKKDKTVKANDNLGVQVGASNKENREFDSLSLVQTLSKHSGTIWTMKFSHDGARLVTGGQDAILRVWKVNMTEKTTQHRPLFLEQPDQSYQGHTMPIVDVSWSRSNFILSASMDKTVRLWHISKEECLHVFQHPDSVPAVDFHPKDDRFFLSGCFDNKARIWNIPDGCVVSYVQTPVMITAATFHPSGSRVVVGLLHGQCILYQVNNHQAMNYYTQIDCRNARGATRKGRKVTGIEFTPEGKFFLVSTNDSRMRLFSVDNYSRVCKYKGLRNEYLQIKARFSQDGEHVICGSENGNVYIWNRSMAQHSTSFMSGKQDRNNSFEFFTAAEPPSGVVTVALFAPASTYALAPSGLGPDQDVHVEACTGYIVSASYDGCIKVFQRH
ncbi:hypothetical protein THRCLA_05359 [Thraustotheca clavata]|uniref:Uncharacterized protein n=1 Tax=Thraustotheca clavata TaxID=74557 RepID=A0A1V9ZW60_9STRA|nr:hypothetical protein THRCLA_05359 [Thraustotheca clavata]